MLTQATQIKNVCVVDPAHLETDADMSLNETPKLSGGFVEGNPMGNGCLFCCSPICIPLSIPATILGWLFYPISVSIRDPDNVNSCGSVRGFRERLAASTFCNTLTLSFGSLRS